MVDLNLMYDVPSYVFLVPSCRQIWQCPLFKFLKKNPLKSALHVPEIPYDLKPL